MAGAGSGWLVGNLPGEVTSFVGRRRETAQATRLLRRARLVTLTGVAGIGKTRLALRVAAQARGAFLDGVWLVELAALTDDALLAPALADVLDIHYPQGQRSATDMLVDYLQDKQLLLVLDNCEHLLDVCAVLACRLLAAAPGLRILATSRQALAASGEHRLEVPPLPVPDPEQPMTPRTVARHEAVRLFAERGAVARPGFVIDPHNRATIVRICRRLDGIPLAIELAALRVRAMPVNEILHGLDDYLGFLAAGSRVAVPRVRTLRAAIDWSFALCSHEEKQLWARASVFAGGFDLDAAEAVCSGQGIAREDVVDLVAGLVDKSVLTRTHEDTGTRARYRMLEAIHQYGQERLASSGQQTAMRARHRDHYRRMVTRAEQEWLGPNELAWFTALRCEHANLRAALEFCLTEPGQARVGIEIAAALWLYWFFSCSHTEGRYWLDRVLESNPQPSSARAKALWLNGELAVMQSDIAAGLSMVEDCRGLAHRLGDESALAHATRIVGVATYFQNDVPGGVGLLEDALGRLRGLRSPDVWVALFQLTVMTATLNEPERAVDLGEECLALSHPRAHLSRSWTLWALAISRWLTDDRQSANRLVREGLRTDQPFTNRWGLAHSIEMLGWIAAAEGQYPRAARLLGAADPLWRSTGVQLTMVRYLAQSHEHCEHIARHALGDEQFTVAFQHGTRFTPDQAIDYALDQTGEPSTTV
ncbi:non-specific serine/threonine protein kinase [Kibdelosporangium banguiense]|uniref:Non-specific serine/threonine protein kinase n=1 Tax=Kibdelosporangium banguiense TaxID=1365924 RepID=A0ABS4T8Q4_9PSEU|nr:AAA family ATPase [Kibdelosporangium banguiense]MBP2320817.1 non-specific serine/threonine protein kinase [Kibdelosporangium banguiense]